MIKLGSPIRQKVLTYFFTNPHQELHLREIARILEIDPGNLSKEMEKIEAEKIFKTIKKGNLKIYSLNLKYPLYKEIKKIIDKTIGIEKKLQEVLRKTTKIDVAFIYGSFAKEKEDRFSDIDLMIIGNPNEDILISGTSSIETNLKREINYNIFSSQEFRKGLEKKEVFLEEIIKNPKKFIIGTQNDLEKIIRR